jgi:hypothetical protein
MALTTVRRSVASLASLAGAVCMRAWGGNLPAALWMPTALLVGAALVVWRQKVGGQLLARAVWWSNLILGTIIALSGSSSERPVAGLLALATGTALLAVGRNGLDEDTPSGSFLPLAFRGTLVCLLVMAMADAQSLVLFGALEVGDHVTPYTLHAGLPIVVALPLLVAVVGLYRLRLWGLLLDLAGSALLGVVAVTHALELPQPLLVAYAVTAAVQWIVALPLVIAILRRRAPAASARLSPHGFALSAVMISLLMIVSVMAGLVVHQRIFYTY